MLRLLPFAICLLLAGPAQAWAAPPPNDAPAGASEFTPYGAGNLPEGETAGEREGLADLSEADADRGVPRCLGPSSFAKTVWFVVPAADVSRLIEVEASSPSGGSAEIPDLALYVGKPKGRQTKQPQACDGAAVGSLATSAAAVAARVPAGREVLIQVGRSGGQAEQRVVASLRTTDLRAVEAPKGDIRKGAPLLALGDANRVPLAGATLTQEDPAQPACPAVATVWRRTPVQRGRYRITAGGSKASTLTAFLGKKPLKCTNRDRRRGPLRLKVRVKRDGVLWTRVGTDTAAGATRLRLAATRPTSR